MNQEKVIKPLNGYLILAITITLIVASIYLLISTKNPLYIFGLVAAIILFKGFVLVNPNNSRVLLLFGKYVGSIKSNGLFWVNPLYNKKAISLRASNFDS